MDEEERSHVETLITTYTRRLQFLQVQRAQTGRETPPHILIEIEDIEKELKELNGRIQRGPVATIDLISFAGAAISGGARERINWTEVFAPTLPSIDTWTNKLLPELKNLKQHLADRGEHVIALRARAHLSIGYAFGYVFRAPTGFQLWIEQPIPNTDQVQWWRANEPPVPGTFLEQERIIRKTKGPDSSIEVSIALNQDIRVPVEQCIRQQRLPIRERILFRPAAYAGATTVQSGTQALAMAIQIRAAIRGLLNVNPHQTIHLFGAIPLGLAVLIGAQLNTCEPVQCYEFDRTTKVYQPSGLLEPHW